MNLKMKSEGGSGNAGGMSGKAIAAIIAAGVIGLGGMGWAVAKALEDPKAKKIATEKPVSADEAKLAQKGLAEKEKSEREADRLKQAEIGQGVQFDNQGNMIQGTPTGSDSAGIQNLALDQVGGKDRAAITAGIQRDSSMPSSSRLSSSSYSYNQEEPQNVDASVIRERREARKEERQESTGPMLAYTTSRTVNWSARRPEGGDTRKASVSGNPEGEMRENESAMARLTNLAEKAMEQMPQSGGPDIAVNVSASGVVVQLQCKLHQGGLLLPRIPLRWPNLGKLPICAFQAAAGLTWLSEKENS